MPRPWRIRYAGAKYHVTSRGNGRRVIFHTEEDMGRFIEQLQSALDQDNVILYAYALMPNHFHLLIETPSGNVQKFMQRLNTAYSLYYRYKHHRPGHCLQGRYSAKVAGGDEYLVRLTRYIHLNPVKTEACGRMSAEERVGILRKYGWSSLSGYVDGKKAQDWVDYRWLKLMGCRTMGANRRAYQRYVETMAAGEDDKLKAAQNSSRYAIGDKEFCGEVAEELRQAEMRATLKDDVSWPEKKAVEITSVASAVSAEYGLKACDLKGRSRRASVAKKVAVELACRYTEKSQREIGLHFGYCSGSAVGKQRQSLRLLLSDPALVRRISKLEKALING